MKRANNEGTLRKRANGSWEARYTVTENGKTVRRSIYGKSQDEVKKKLTKVLFQIDTGKYIAPLEMTCEEWFTIWLNEYCGGVKESTRQQYLYNFRVHIKPELGQKPLQKINPVIIQKFINGLSAPRKKTLKDGTEKTVNGLSPKSVKNISGILHESFAVAVRIGYLQTNPSESAKLPRCEKKEMQVLDTNELKAFLDEIAGKPFESLFKVAVFTGMRRSELLGLKWQDIDFKTGKIEIVRQRKCERTEAGKNITVFDTLKNGKTREIFCPDFVLRELKAEKVKQAENKLKFGEAFSNEDGLVFVDEIGKPLSHSTVYHALKARAEAIGKPELKLHSLRHTFATLNLALGSNVKTVSESLGHATVSFTLDVYGHSTDELKQAMASSLQGFISENIGG